MFARLTALRSRFCRERVLSIATAVSDPQGQDDRRRGFGRLEGTAGMSARTEQWRTGSKSTPGAKLTEGSVRGYV